MGVMDKFLSAMQLNPDDNPDSFYDEDEDDGYYDDPEPAVKRPIPMKEETAVKDDTEKKPRLTAVKGSKKTMGTTGMEVCVIKPTSVDDSREITDTLLLNRTVVLNLEGLDMDVAQRIIDFTSGSCYAIKGNLQKISHYIFIITPPSVDISGDFQEILAGTFDVNSGI